MYKHTDTTSIIRIFDGAFIPADERNSDYAAYLAWVEAGNKPEPADIPPVVIPQSVTRFQARAALHLAGLLQSVEAMMSDPSVDMLAKLAWQDAQEFKRTSPTVLAMANALKLTDAQLDDLFIHASEIKA